MPSSPSSISGWKPTAKKRRNVNAPCRAVLKPFLGHTETATRDSTLALDDALPHEAGMCLALGDNRMQ